MSLLFFWKDGWNFLPLLAAQAEPAPGSGPATVGGHGNCSPGPAGSVGQGTVGAGDSRGQGADEKGPVFHWLLGMKLLPRRQKTLRNWSTSKFTEEKRLGTLAGLAFLLLRGELASGRARNPGSLA